MMNNVQVDKELREMRVRQSYSILHRYKTERGAFLASASSDYSKVWLRDSMYIGLSFIDKACNTFEKAIQAHLDYFRQYEWKLNIHLKQKPKAWFEFMHIRYSAHDMKEIDQEWSHTQNDAIGLLLWSIGEGIKRGKKVLRDEKDREIVQKIVLYLETLEYHKFPCSSMWEEEREVRLSSVAAVVAGLENISDIVYIPAEMIQRGYQTIFELFPNESATRHVDSALLSLIYPYCILPKPMSQLIIHNVEKELLRERGCIRYHLDSYFSTLEKEFGRGLPKEMYANTEAEWTMFLPWLSLCYQTIGDYGKAEEYLEWTERVMLPDGRLPELYYAKSDAYNSNTPLLWANSMYIQAKEGLDKLSENN